MLQEKPKHSRRQFAVLAYIVPLVGGLIGLAADGNNQLTRNHAQQSLSALLTLVLSFLAWAIAGWVIALIPGIGPIIALSLFTLVIALAAFLAVNWLISLARALRGEERTIPLANRIALRLFGDIGVENKSD